MTPGFKRCAGWCGRTLALAEYNFDRYSKDGRQAYCPDCKARATRDARWLKLYNLLPGRAARCLEVQGGKCPICLLPLSLEIQRAGEGTPGDECTVDHCHSSGEVRGLLHNRCNRDPQNEAYAARWREYRRSPPMRAAQDGKVLHAPIASPPLTLWDELGGEPPPLRDVVVGRHTKPQARRLRT
jgi:hypothetical protein